ncbi:Eco57I restriction-modification methylase domain-containing protein [Polaribacter sp. IC073]|uniref:Eco57I restriction-modification methylase domain-containing protein n=1 Tax=Polaribacter sp. IC073 TaxID=2508540 RepID=UPI0011BE943E|nr:N-6 DNA methylase [Polaribacter sp. IC073]TXD47772.1 N-6 DNA methylase [Polaribacter sp. IC073]
MSLFQNTVITKYLKSQNKEEISIKWNLFKNHFQNPTIQENIRNSKEEQYQGGFIIDLFVNVLGYTKNPTPNFNITTEYKNVKDSKKADGAIVVNDEVKAVIELKGTNTTDLGKIEVQAFGYKNNQPKCTYVITSNFEKIRFYIDNAIEHIEFNLFTLTEKDFELLYLCLGYENLSKDVANKIKKDSLSEEDVITKSLYKDYSLFKRELHQNLIQLNPQYDSLTLFKESQTLLDRFLFLFFAEDRQLLPPNSVRLILTQWKKLQELDAYTPLFDRFKKYFGYLNTGFKGKQYDVYAYNGGLFKPNIVLDTVIIDDDLLYKHTLKLSDYDFDSEVDVNILGHIFENSLNELDEVKAELEGQVVDKSKSKRKKDGVFYTPKYITKYIVENTVGKLCVEKKVELQLIDEDYSTDKKRQKKTIKGLVDKLTTYRNWLLQVTICDPACGSGAFLNQALDFLISEHSYIDELQAKLFGDAMVLSDVEKSILENNLFGVDLNDESVEIAKLSLWLRTAQSNRKLNDLNNNLKCGNSLIDDPEIAGDKAFNWQQEFPHIFEKGGFDVVIGNPPYVRQELFKEIKPYLEKNYKCYNSVADLYTYFIEKGINLMNEKGLFSFILPNKFLKATYGKEIRKVIKEEGNLELIYDFDDYSVFDDATTYPIIYVLNKNTEHKADSFLYSEINKRENTHDPINRLKEKEVKVKYSSLGDEYWQFQNIKSAELLQKLYTDTKSLKEIVSDKIFRGVSTGKNEVFIIEKETYEKLINDKNKEFIRKIVTGKEVKRNSLIFSDLYLLFIPWEYDLEFDDNIKNYLIKNKEILSKRPEVKQGRFNWWCLSRYGSKNADYLFKPKIIYPRINNQCNFYFDSSGEFSLSDNNFFISTDDKFLIPILNSKVVFFYLKSKASTLQGGYLDFRRPYIETIPIKIPSFQQPFIEKADLMLLLNKNLQEISSKFQRTLQREFEQIDKLSKKLESWYELNYADFLKELKKKKVALSLSQKAEWEDYFLKEQQKAIELKTKIDTTDNEIDAMVYDLYGLTQEEIEIVENS